MVSLSLPGHEVPVKPSNAHYTEQWEWFEVSTVGEKVMSCIAGKCWTFSALTRIMNEWGEKCTTIGHSQRPNVGGAELRIN